MPSASAAHAGLIRQLETIADLNDGDRAAITALPLRMKSIEENRDVLHEGQRSSECCLIVEGVVCRYKMIPGGRRQIVSFHFMGDLADLQSLNLGHMDHSIAALTPTQVAFIPHEAIRALMRQRPGVADAFLRHTLIDGSIFREWITNVGRRTALERVAHLICECFLRMRAVGLTKASIFRLPMTQLELADATGLSNVHVNRTLQQMRQDGLISSKGNVHSILDWDLLRETGGFDPAYLHMRVSETP